MHDSSSLYAPYRHVAGLKSKNLRDGFIDALNRILCADEAHVTVVKAVIQKLHNASLLLDDIEDGATRRRGQPAAHVVFGVPLTMNAASLVIFEALGDCVAIAKSDPELTVKAVSVFQEEIVLLHQGQGLDILWRDQSHCPTLEDYRSMVIKKTGGLFRLALRLMALHATRNRPLVDELISLTEEIGYFYQVLDDLMNLVSTDYYDKKVFCEDITEGKFSFLTSHSVLEARKSGDERLRRVLSTHPTSVDVKLFCLDLMKETNTFEYTHTHLASVAQKIQELLLNMETKLSSGTTHRALVAFTASLISMVPKEGPPASSSLWRMPSRDGSAIVA